MSQPLEIFQLGSPIIRTVAKKVLDVHATEVQCLIDSMIQTCLDSKGVGIAAPQVGHSLAIIIMASAPNKRYPYAPHMEPTALINPRVVDYSEEKVKDWEGCLSVPGIRAQVPRHTHIEVEYVDRDAKAHRVVFRDFLSRLFQHEYDHLIGKVFIDRVESTHEMMSEKEYQKMMSNA